MRPTPRASCNDSRIRRPSNAQRARARDLGVKPGVFSPGKLNAITDVAGVRVGQTTVVQGDGVRTGVTAILPHGGNLFTDRVPAALHVGNGFGKITGVTQLRELGELETPILLTCTLCVWKAADAMVGWLLEQPGMANVRSINPVVAETNDGTLNDIRSRPIHAGACARRADVGVDGSGGGGRGRRGNGNGRVRLEGRHRHVVARAAGVARRLDRRRARADELRRNLSGARRAGREGAWASTRSSARPSRRASAATDRA